jgi:hypothetical protein
VVSTQLCTAARTVQKARGGNKSGLGRNVCDKLMSIEARLRSCAIPIDLRPWGVGQRRVNQGESITGETNRKLNNRSKRQTLQVKDPTELDRRPNENGAAGDRADRASLGANRRLSADSVLLGCKNPISGWCVAAAWHVALARVRRTPDARAVVGRSIQLRVATGPRRATSFTRQCGRAAPHPHGNRSVPQKTWK